MGREDRHSTSVRRELWSWARALLIAAPLGVGVWYVVRELPAPWDTAYPVLAIIPFLVIGLLSQSNLWTLLIWLLPLVALQLVFIAGVRGPARVACSVLVVVWVSGLMMFESFFAAVLRASDGLFQFLVATGLSPDERDAYRAFRRVSSWTEEEVEDAQQLQDIARTARAFRAPGLRINALNPPGERWAEAFDASAASFLRGAEMFESGQPVDYEALSRMIARRQEMIHQLLRDESLPYRILTFIPGSLLRR
jgi:hypothetical protein